MEVKVLICRNQGGGNVAVAQVVASPEYGTCEFADDKRAVLHSAMNCCRRPIAGEEVQRQT